MNYLFPVGRHCEARSAVAIQEIFMDCFDAAHLAMTAHREKNKSDLLEKDHNLISHFQVRLLYLKIRRKECIIKKG